MFSYMSSKASQSTLENNLIEQIQSIGNDIFDFQQSSVTRTEQQEMSLEYSSVTDEDLNNEHKNLIFKQTEEHFLSSQPLDQQLNFGNKPISRTVHPRNFKQANKEKQGQESFRRLTKSMVSGHLISMQPGSFSNKYNESKNISHSNISPVPKKQDHEKENNLSLSALNPRNQNKENILAGILRSAKPKASSKTPNKKGKFSSSYASNYLSPYSLKGIRQLPNSYMDKSNTQINTSLKKHKQTIELQYIKQRLNQNIEPQISYRKEKEELNRLKNPKLSHVKSKYKETKPLMHQYKLYADEHIHKKMKNQMGVWVEKKKYYQTLSNDEIQQNWQDFIQKENRFLEEKKKTILTKQLERTNREATQFNHSPSKNVLLNGRNSMIEVTPPKMTPEDYIKKYKREKEKLKQKLHANQVSNFIEKTYENVKHFGKELFESVWGSTITVSKPSESLNASNLDGQYSNFKESSTFEIDPISKLLIDNNGSSCKQKHENFFVSVGGQSYKSRSFKKKPKDGNFGNYSNKLMARSSIQRTNSKSIGKSQSREPKSANRQSLSAKKAEGINSLSPFIKKQSYFSGNQLPIDVRAFDPRQHNSPLFNEQLKTGKSKSKSNTKNNRSGSNLKISELLNPKYFKSINELQEYASTSRQKSDKIRKTFEASKEGESSLQLQEKDLTYKNFRKSSPKRYNQEKASGFDKKLMNKIIQDLDHMRNEIEENKKKRLYRIQNYRNISNLRKDVDEEREEKDLKQSLPVQSAIRKSRNQLGQFGSRERHDQVNGKRENHRFKDSINEQTDPSDEIVKRGSNMFASRSVSPIEKEDSILMNQNNLSLSMIEPVQEGNENSAIKNLKFSQFNSRMVNSSLIMVKSREEVEFIFRE